MIVVKAGKTINSPLNEVFAKMADIANAADFIDGITKIDMLTEGPIGVGTRWRETRVMFGREATEEMCISEFVPNKHYTVEAESCGAKYRTDLCFKSVGENSTEIEMQTTCRPLTVFAKLMSPLGWLMKGSLAKCLEKDLEDVRVSFEGRTVAT